MPFRQPPREESKPPDAPARPERIFLIVVLSGLAVVGAGVAYFAWYDPPIAADIRPAPPVPRLLERTYEHYRMFQEGENAEEYCARATDWPQLAARCRFPSRHDDSPAAVRLGPLRRRFSYPPSLAEPEEPWSGLGDATEPRELAVPIPEEPRPYD